MAQGARTGKDEDVEPGWVPPEIDTTKANIARVYDYWLGGSHNFLADQDVARAMIAVDPNIRAMMRANRAFLGRAVRYLAREADIGQFLDIGSGIPTEQNVHEVAQAAAPGSRVVYVDNDEVAVAHSRLMLEDNPDATVIRPTCASRARSGRSGNPAAHRLHPARGPAPASRVALRPDGRAPARILATLRARGPPRQLPGHLPRLPGRQARHRGQRDRRVQQPGRGEPAGAHPRRDRGPVRRLHPGGAGAYSGAEWRARLTADVPENPEFWALVGVARRDA
jgi:hypothetical protein